VESDVRVAAAPYEEPGPLAPVVALVGAVPLASAGQQWDSHWAAGTLLPVVGPSAALEQDIH